MPQALFVQQPAWNCRREAYVRIVRGFNLLAGRGDVVTSQRAGDAYVRFRKRRRHPSRSNRVEPHPKGIHDQRPARCGRDNHLEVAGLGRLHQRDVRAALSHNVSMVRPAPGTPTPVVLPDDQHLRHDDGRELHRRGVAVPVGVRVGCATHQGIDDIATHPGGMKGFQVRCGSEREHCVDLERVVCLQLTRRGQLLPHGKPQSEVATRGMAARNQSGHVEVVLRRNHTQVVCASANVQEGVWPPSTRVASSSVLEAPHRVTGRCDGLG